MSDDENDHDDRAAGGGDGGGADEEESQPPPPPRKRPRRNADQTCPSCHAVFVDLARHTTCPAGTCRDCGLHSRKLDTHVCAIRRWRKQSGTALADETERREFESRLRAYVETNVRTCSWCRQAHATKTSIRTWKSQTYCVDCFYRCGFNDESESVFRRVRAWLLDRGLTQCETCRVPCIRDVTGDRLRNFELDHVRYWDKVDSVGNMVRSGADWTMIVTELEKCRVLCQRCHGFVTASEHVGGYHDLKRMERRRHHQRQQQPAADALAEIVACYGENDDDRDVSVPSAAAIVGPDDEMMRTIRESYVERVDSLARRMSSMV